MPLLMCLLSQLAICEPTIGTDACRMATSNQVKQSRQHSRPGPLIRADRKRIQLKVLAKVSLQRFCTLPVRPEN
jgi:hypothetical protein